MASEVTMPRTLTVLLVLALSLLTGCASLSKSQCLADDWQTVGYRDGLAGAQQSNLLRHQNACVKHGVHPDRAAYIAGWHDGVTQYCRPGNAFRLGERGAGYGNVCPEHMQTDFDLAYQDGRRIHLAGVEVDRLRGLLQSHDLRVRDIKAELTGIAAAMLESHHTPADRAAMLLTAKDLAEEKAHLERDMDALRLELVVKEEELAHLRHELAYVR
jgi:hypothetical protein